MKKILNKINFKKITIFILFIFISFFFSSEIEAKENIKINNRGLIFNNGIYSDNIRLLKDFFRVKEEPNVPWGYEYDNVTKELVRKYQKNNDLKADGIVGKSTLSKINEEIRINNYKIGLREPVINKSGTLILVNKSSNTLYLIQNGVIKDVYPIATGKTSGLTPNGKHKVVLKLLNPDWGGAGISEPIKGGAPNNPLGSRWIGISYGGGGKYGIHGNSNSSSIGKKVSLGCIRMYNSDVEKIFNKVKSGDSVWIGDENLLENYGVKFKHKYPKNTGYKRVNHKLKINGVNYEVKNIINKEGRNYYPFREILGLVNADVLWDQGTKTATGILNGNKVSFKLNENFYELNGEKVLLPINQKAFIEKDTMYIPIRFAFEGLGFEVKWNEETTTVLIKTI